MRIAYTGAMPQATAGASRAGLELLQALLVHPEVSVDIFAPGGEPAIPESLREHVRVRSCSRVPPWSWNRWYSRTDFTAFITGQSARAYTQMRLARDLLELHRHIPYDIVYQYSQIELLGLGRILDHLPPVVIHPEVHAAGELRHMRKEASMLPGLSSRWRGGTITSLYQLRARSQGRDARRVAAIVSPSIVFARHLVHDYGLNPERISVVRNPIDLDRMQPSSARGEQRSPVRLLFAGRLAVRKGLELIVALSHRLDDLRGSVEILVVGSHSLWSNYRPMLDGLNSSIGQYCGSREPDEMPETYARVDALLMPSAYEPFGLSASEALATGLPVIASTEVGAVEDVDPRVARMFAPGDIDALERAARDLVEELKLGAAPRLAVIARAEASRLFAPGVIGAKLLDVLREEAAS